MILWGSARSTNRASGGYAWQNWTRGLSLALLCPNARHFTRTVLCWPMLAAGGGLLVLRA